MLLQFFGLVVLLSSVVYDQDFAVQHASAVSKLEREF